MEGQTNTMLQDSTTKNIVSGYLRGGLGNQLFIMAAAYGHAIINGSHPAIYCPHVYHTPHSKEHYEDTIFSNFPQITVTSNKPSNFFTEPANAATGTLLPIPVVQGWQVLVGYFQHSGYMGSKNAFIKMLNLPSINETIKLEMLNTCFIHVRRTDYLHAQNAAIHYVDLSTYYPLAIDYVKNRYPHVKFLIFSDDVPWCKAQSVFANMDICEEPNEVSALILMSHCNIGGIAANSSFSWWGAFLNNNPNKVVTFPKTWFNIPISPHPGFSGATLL